MTHGWIRAVLPVREIALDGRIASNEVTIMQRTPVSLPPDSRPSALPQTVAARIPT